jgi:hypothetical protein
MNKYVLSHLPRNGRYELFSYKGKTSCYDDPEFESIVTPAGMFEWIRSQDNEYWKPMDSEPESNVALYLTPELYLLWKLKFS